MDISFPRALTTIPTERSAGVGGALGPGSATGATPRAAESFGALLSQAVQDLDGAQRGADAGAAALAAGAPVDLHQVLIGTEQAHLAFGLALQVRNKLIEAYQEISRMPV